ncbi:MAG: DUF956 family protein [Clostridiales bacterium]|nr:DUF956 family protein [Clostridiales bacterium]
MAQSLNARVDFVIDATSYSGLNSYGKIMIGDRAFEYYNNRKVEDYIQIPWENVDYVIASVMFGGRYIPRIAVRTRQGRDFSFAARKPRELLRAIRKYVPSDHMVRSLTLVGVLKKRLKERFKK